MMTAFKFLTITAFAFCNLAPSYGQADQGKTRMVNHIRKVFKETNQASGYKTIKIEDAEKFLGHPTDNGGKLTGYFKNDTLKKITEWVGLSNKVIQNDYYFDQAKLVFVYSTERSYRYDKQTQSLDYTKLDNVFQGRYYFNNNQLIESVLSNKQHQDTRQQDATVFLTSGNNYSKLLNTK